MGSVYELLEKLQPKFHVLGAYDGSVNIERIFMEGIKTTDDMPRSSNAISPFVLRYLESAVKENHRTIETGAGWSTVVLASRAISHVAVNPDATSNRLIKEFMDKEGIKYNSLSFLENSSDFALPNYKTDDFFDFLVIDGNHSFPYPMIDWHYIDPFLNVNAQVLIDDNYIPSVKMLVDFLSYNSSYKLLEHMGKCSTFQKISKEREMGWYDQRYNIKFRKQPSKVKLFIKQFIPEPILAARRKILFGKPKTPRI